MMRADARKRLDAAAADLERDAYAAELAATIARIVDLCDAADRVPFGMGLVTSRQIRAALRGHR